MTTRQGSHPLSPIPCPPSRFKRLIDITTSATLLLGLAPVFGVIAAGIYASSPGPVFFRQQRVGRGGRSFVLHKFRSMHPGPERATETWKGDPRVFPFGRFLREYHLDELPQLWNVLAGDMSLVGPRPTVPEQVGRYSERERGRLAVRPGLTGLAQVSGGNALDWNQRIEIDLEYIERSSLGLDLAILARTLPTVLRRDGIYAADGRVHDKTI